MIVSSAGVYTTNSLSLREGAIALIVLCKITAYTKTLCFCFTFVFFDDAGVDIEDASLEGEEQVSNRLSKEDVVFRWGVAGIQAGGFVGAILFFLLTVPHPC